MSKQHQKSEDLCNNREELTGKKLSFRCGMLQNPHQQLPESGAAACCGMLLPLVPLHTRLCNTCGPLVMLL